MDDMLVTPIGYSCSCQTAYSNFPGKIMSIGIADAIGSEKMGERVR